MSGDKEDDPPIGDYGPELYYLKDKQKREIEKYFKQLADGKDKEINSEFDLKIGILALNFDYDSNVIQRIIRKSNARIYNRNNNIKEEKKEEVKEEDEDNEEVNLKEIQDNEKFQNHKLQDFINLAMDCMKAKSPQKMIKRAFKLYDQNNKGKIVLEDLKLIAYELSEKLTDFELQKILDKADSKKQGGIDFEDFSKLMMELDVFEFF